MRVLLTGNHTCGNRGDAAILRGLLTHVEQLLPSAEVTVTSRYPVSSTYLLGRPVIADPMTLWEKDWQSPLPDALRRRYLSKAVPRLMARSVKEGTPESRLLPAPVRKVISDLRRYDFVIQVGGSFFVDLYGMRQFEMAFASMLAGKPVALLGHSMGPFGGAAYKSLVETLLHYSDSVSLREDVSRRMLAAIEVPTEKLHAGADTAWLVDPETVTSVGPDISALTSGRPAVAITLRDLAPFDKRLKVSQSEFEEAFSDLASAIIEKGYDIVACSTCTGIESYHRDDRIPALRVRSRVERKDRFHVIMDELNDVQLGKLIRSCELLVGTRLHSAIIGMNFGTPAIALNYEHKSEGILAQIGHNELSSPIGALIDGSLKVKVLDLLRDVKTLRSEISIAVGRERQRARDMVDAAIETLGSRSS